MLRLFLLVLLILFCNTCFNVVNCEEGQIEVVDIDIGEIIITNKDVLDRIVKEGILTNKQMIEFTQFMKQKQIQLITKENHLLFKKRLPKEMFYDEEMEILKQELIEELREEQDLEDIDLEKLLEEQKRVEEEEEKKIETMSGWFWNLFSISNIFYFICSTVLLSCCTLLLVTVWDAQEGLGGGIVALIYSSGFIAVGISLNNITKSEAIPGLLYTIAITLIPVILFSFERYAGLWDDFLNSFPSINTVSLKKFLQFGQYLTRKQHAMILSLFLSALIPSIILLIISSAVFVQAPFYLSLYGTVLGIGFVLEKNVPQKFQPFWIYLSFGYSLLLFVLSNIMGENILGNLRLGAMISSINIYFFTFPFLLCKYSFDEIQNQYNIIKNKFINYGNKPSKTIIEFFKILVPHTPPKQINLIIMIYGITSVILLLYGIISHSWIVVPCGVIGLVIASVLMDNSLIYIFSFHIPAALFLGLMTAFYSNITDNIWMDVLIGFGTKPVMNIFGRVFCQTFFSLGCSLISMYVVVLLRTHLTLYHNIPVPFASAPSLNITLIINRVRSVRVFVSCVFYFMGIFITVCSNYNYSFFSNIFLTLASIVLFFGTIETLDIKPFHNLFRSSKNAHLAEATKNIIPDLLIIGYIGYEICAGASNSNFLIYLFGCCFIINSVLSLYFPFLFSNKLKTKFDKPSFFIGFSLDLLFVLFALLCDFKILTLLTVIVAFIAIFRLLYMFTQDPIIYMVVLTGFIFLTIFSFSMVQFYLQFLKNLFFTEQLDSLPMYTYFEPIEISTISSFISFLVQLI
eukprot:TRINITY_DN880_c0_g1_i2.p1 TRINITY_DN880_c0_g1~~TRINITY_DN880_c0_g1_i2.p1  ORF type:complete len:800 (-),score=139.47 TRINITY_DN880_c0_g1_i2:61-2460(-)